MKQHYYFYARLALYLGVVVATTYLGWGQSQPIYAQSGTIRYVAIGGSDSGNCSASNAPCLTIQYALGQAAIGDEIRIAGSGTSYGPVNITKNNITLSGGFSTGNWTTADPVVNVTKLDAQQLGQVITVTGNISVTIQGLHITNGKLTGTNSSGAGVLNSGGKVILKNNFIYGNIVEGGSAWGAGVSSNNGTITIQQNRIYQNQASNTTSGATSAGGGIGIQGTGTALIERNWIYENQAGAMGGGIAIRNNNTTTIQNNLIYDNKTTAGSTFDGGGGLGIYNNGGKVFVAHNTFFGNISANNGGAVVVGMIGNALTPKPSILMTNTLIVSNTSKSATRGGIHVLSGSAITVSFTTLYSNTPATNGTEVTNGASNVTTTPAGPQFVNEAARDFHLIGGAQAINTGTDAGVTTDFDGVTRPFGANFDRGAYEFAQVLSCFAHLPNGQDFTNIQLAVNAANAGDVVKVAGVCGPTEGTAHAGSLQVVYINKSLTLRGGYSSADWINPTHGAAVLDAANGGRVIFVDSTANQVTLENLILANGSVGANDGGGLYLTGAGSALLQNSVFYNNKATRGGAVYNTGTRLVTLNHNTFYQNAATSSGGAVYADGSGVVTLKNNLIANSTGSGIAAGSANRFSQSYNLFDNNTPGHYGANTLASATDLTGAAGLTDPANQDFHVGISSAGINQAEPSAGIATDFDGAARPIPTGGRADIGADESLFYLGLGLPASPDSPKFASTVQGGQVTFRHTINSSSKTPTGKTTFKIETSNNNGWAVNLVGVTSPVELADGESRTFDVVVTTAGPLTGQVDNRTIITATAEANPAVTQSQNDFIVGTLSQIAPSYIESSRPGDILTYTHILTNNSSTADTYAIVVSSPRGWAKLVVPTPTTATLPTIVVGPNASVKIVVQVEVGKSAAQGVEDVMTVTAKSQNTQVDVTVTNTTTAQATIGTRHVATTGSNDANNCTQKETPCKTIAYALNQAASGDEVLIAQGTYDDGDLVIKQVSLRGGYTPNFSSQVLNPKNTIIDANNTRRGLLIQTAAGTFRPVIEGFTIRNGTVVGAAGGGIFIQASGSFSLSHVTVDGGSAAQGGGIFVSATGSSKPTLEYITISNTVATGRGGGIYLAGGTMTMEAITISNTSANVEGGGIYNEKATATISRTKIGTTTATLSGGAIYNLQGTVNLWNSTLFNNQAKGGDGGAVYNSTGSINLLHDTFDGNTASGRGGTIYHNSGIIQVVSSIIANGTAPTVGGLFYNTSGTVDYNLYFNNANGHSNAITGTKSLTADPLFLNRAQTNYTLSPGSPAIDAGNPSSPLTIDIEGDQRPKDQGFDIGSDEAGSCVVKIGQKIYGSPQEAINEATPGSKLEISGVCRGAQPFAGLNTGTCQAQFVQGMVITKDLVLQGGSDITGTFDAAGQGRILTVIGSAKVQINDLNFINGQSDFGGAIYNCGGTVTLQGGTLKNNTASRSGGAIYNHISSTVLLGIDVAQLEALKKATTLEKNTATENGGVLYNLGIFSSRLVTMSESQAAKGGAFYNDTTGRLALNGTTVVSSTASDGAGLYNTGILTSENSIFAGGTGQNGVGMYNLASTFIARHNTFYLNTATGQGGGIFINAPTSDPIINSNLFKDNIGVSIFSPGSAPQITYNGFTDAGIGGTGNVGNITFNFASTSFGGTNYLRLASGAFPEDKGDPNSPVRIDIDNKPRPANESADMGASEVGSCYVRINGIAPTYGSIQYALGLSKAGDELRIAGTCTGARPMVDTGTGQTVRQTVFITMPIKIRGGFTPTDFSLSEPKKNPTTLDALGLGRVFYITNSAVVSIANLRLTGGAASQGAAVYNGNGEVVLDGNEIFKNDANQGAAFYHAAGRLDVWNNAIYKNTAPNGAGGYNVGSQLKVWHNTYYQNQASTNGAGMYTENNGADIRNNIFLEDQGPNVIFSAVPLTVDYNNVFGQNNAAYGGSATAGSHVFAVNPNLENPSVGDFTLQGFSSMIDVGDDTMTLTHDYEGHLRPGNQGFDLGRDELPGCKARIVRTKEVFGNVQVAIKKSEKDDIIQVVAEPCNGVQLDIVNGKPLSQTVYLNHTLTLLGGFSENFAQQTKSPTILDPKGLGRAMLIEGGAAITIDNFILQNGNARGLGGGPGGADAGGALLYLNNGQVLITNTRFISSTAAHGGAIYNDGTGLTILGSSIASSTATVSGGGVYNNGGSMNLYRTKVNENKAPQGAGFYNGAGAPTLDYGTSFYRNEATGNGGGLYSAVGDIKIWNTIFYENRAASGAGIYLAGGNGQVFHNTLHANVVSSQGGGLFIGGGTPVIKNNIFSEHTTGSGSAIFGATGTANYNNYFNNSSPDIAGGLSHGANDLGVDPLFGNPTTGDFSLRSESPMIDAGDVTVNVFHDFDDPANPRPINTAPDLGVDEYNDCLVKLMRTGEIFGQIKQALAQAVDGDIIHLTFGRCQENVFINKSVTIQGGFLKDFTPPPNNLILLTTIDAAGKGRPMEVGPVKAIISQVSLVNGNTTTNGAGLLSNAESLIMFYTSIYSNTTTKSGGGAYIATGTADLAADISFNHADGDGGGLYNESGTTVSAGGGIAFNTAGHDGGGVYNNSNSVVNISGGSPIEGNVAANNGGGVYNNGAKLYSNQKRSNFNQAINGGGFYIIGNSEVVLENLGLTGNQASQNGGGMYRVGSGTTVLHHALIRLNDARGQGGGIFNDQSPMSINASILSENTAATGGAGVHSGPNVNVTYTLIWQNESVGITEGAGNIHNQNPLVLESGGDLSQDSPAIDSVPVDNSPTTIDRFGEPRPLMCTKDMGRDEFRVFREMAWQIPSGSEKLGGPSQLITHTYVLTNENRNLTGGAPYQRIYASYIGSGYTETVRLVLTSTRQWSKINRVFVTTSTLVTITNEGLSAQFNLGSGERASIEVVTAIPTGAKASVDNDPETMDKTTLTANPQYWNRHGPPESCATLTGEDRDPTWVSPAATTKVSSDYNFVIGPAQQGYAIAGQKITYTHYITNIGNSIDTYLLFAKPGYYASGEIQPNQVTLKPGESRKFIMIVTINQEAAGGLVDHTSAIAQVVLPDKVLPVQAEVINDTTIGYRTGTRYVLFNDGRDSLVDETEGSLDPEAVDLPDNNCTQPLIGPCATLEMALAQAADGDLIKIAAGTYLKTLMISKSVTIQGGNNSNNWELVPPNHLSFTTYLAPETGRAVYVAPGKNVTLERLVIQNGKAAGLGGGTNGEDVGGNILNDGDSLTLNTNRIMGGQAVAGAGLYNRGGKLVLRNNLFHDNLGGAVFVQAGEARLENNDFFRNTLGTGGAVNAIGASLVARNNIFAQNGANSVLATTATLDYNLYHGGDGVSGGANEGVHSITNDPMFVASNATLPDLKLLEGSPAIDAGDPTTNIGPMPYDYGNSPRRSGLTSRIDIGAYEFYVAPLFTFVPDNEVVVPLGEQRTFTHTLTNLSNGTDTFNVTLSSPLQWVGVNPSSPQTLAPGQSVTLVALATVPANVAIGTTEVAVITVTSQANPQALAYVIDSISAGAVPIQLAVDGATTGQVGIPYRFTATAGPDRVVQPITYTWEALGLPPIVHTGALSDMVEFTWSTVGPKVITITADNGQVKSVVYHTIDIQDKAVIPLSVQVTGATAGLTGIEYEFIATVSPNQALAPLTYIWTASGQNVFTHTVNTLTDTVRFTWFSVAPQTITVSVVNIEGTAIASYPFILTSEPQPPLGVILNGPTSALYNQDLTFMATVSPMTTTQPITYLWEASGLAAQTIVVTNGLQGEVVFNWGLVTGTQRVTVTASNGAGVTVQATHDLFVSDKPLAPVTLQISGPQSASLNTMTAFVATVSPNNTSQPLTYTWSTSENGTVVQTNNLTDSVSFSWSSAGLKTITVVAQNEGGAVTSTYNVQVGALTPQAPTRVDIIGPTAGLVGEIYTFQANVFPITSTQPLLYSWQATGNPAMQALDTGMKFIWSTPGTYQVNLTVSNGLGSVSQSFTVVITAEPLPPLSVKINGITAGLMDTNYVFTATTSPLTTTQMLTYVWQATGNPILQSARQNSSLTQNDKLLTSAANFRWSVQGLQTITVTVMNGAGSATTVYSVNITLAPEAPTAVVISGPTTGETRRDYVFTATVSGPLTTQPLTYRWQATGLTTRDQVNNLEDKITFNWSTAGTKLITVTAINGGGQAVDSHTIAIKLANTTLYLPILLKGQAVVVTPTATAQANTPTATTQANTPTATATSKTPTATTNPNTPTATTQANTPTATATSKTPTATTNPNTPTATSQANTPTATTTSSTPTATMTPDRPPLDLPDLVVDSFTITDLGNGQYQANVTIRNQAAFAVTVGNNFYLGLYVDQTNVDPPIFWGLQGAWFTPGAARSFTQQFTAATVGSGSHTFIVWVDPYNVVSESDENNNTQQQGGVVINGVNGESREAPHHGSSGPLPTPTMEINEEK